MSRVFHDGVCEGHGNDAVVAAVELWRPDGSAQGAGCSSNDERRMALGMKRESTRTAAEENRFHQRGAARDAKGRSRRLTRKSDVAAMILHGS